MTIRTPHPAGTGEQANGMTERTLQTTSRDVAKKSSPSRKQNKRKSPAGSQTAGRFHGLTGKQAAFVDYWIAERYNGTKAAELAGYKGSPATLAVVASENLRKPNIQAAITERLQARHLSADQVLDMLADHAMATLADFLDIETFGAGDEAIMIASLNLGKAAKSGKLHQIQKITFHDETGMVKSLELVDRQHAIDQIGRYKKLFTDRVEVFDWRKEVEEAGLSTGDVFQQLVNQLAANFAAGAGSTDDRGGEAG